MELALALIAPIALIAGFALAFGSSARGAVGTVAQARKGERVRVAGRVLADKPLQSPVAEERCVYWHLEIATNTLQGGNLDLALGSDHESLERRRSDTDRTSAWADGLRIEDATGALLLNPIGGRIETTHGSQLRAGFLPSERIREIVRKHSGAGVEAETRNLEERVLEVGAQVVVEGVVEDIKGRLFLGGEGRFSVEPATAAQPPSAGTVLLGRVLLAVGALCALVLLYTLIE